MNPYDIHVILSHLVVVKSKKYHLVLVLKKVKGDPHNFTETTSFVCIEL